MENRAGLSDADIRGVVKKQIRAISRTGFEPSWDLFVNTFGWYQIKAKLSGEERKRYEEIWKNEELVRIRK